MYESDVANIILNSKKSILREIPSYCLLPYTRKRIFIDPVGLERNWASLNYVFQVKDVRDRSAIMECEVRFGAKILSAYSPLDIKVKQQLQSGENASLYVIK